MAIVAGPTRTSRLRWYATKREHGRVVPTWNYITAHVLRTARDPRRPGLGRGQRAGPERPARGRRASGRGRVDDAPAPYIDGQLKAIVGVEIVIDRVEGKWKLSQNRSDADIRAIEGRTDGGARVSGGMRELAGAALLIDRPSMPGHARWTFISFRSRPDNGIGPASQRSMSDQVSVAMTSRRILGRVMPSTDCLRRR